MLSVELAGARGRVRSAYEPFARYAAVHLAPLRAEDGDSAVEATLRWHEGAPPGPRSAACPWIAGMERIDRDLYRDETRLSWFRVDELPDLFLHFRLDGHRLFVEGDYYHRLSKGAQRDRVKRLLYRRRLTAMRQRRFTTLLYYLVYYPLFWWLERRRGLHPIHAAGVETPDGVIVLAGPSGVGKSTLAAGLAGNIPGARLLSDTFLLHDGVTVHPVREPLLLDEWSRRWIGEAAGLLRPIPWQYCLGREGFHWPANRLSEGGPADLLLFPHRAPQAAWRAVAASQAHGRISAADFIINDLRRYWAYAAVLEMLNPCPLMFERERSLAALVDAVPCYELGLTRDVAVSEVAAVIGDRLAGGRSRSGPGHGAGAGR